MAQYDIEEILGEVRTFLLANLNTQIIALNTEKNDAITLTQVASSAYHLQTLEDRIDVADPIVLYGEAAEPLVVSVAHGVSVEHHVSVWLVLADNGTDSQIVNRLFRYRRVLLDLFRMNWASFVSAGVKLKIHASSPSDPFKDQETGYKGRAVGVIISFVLAS